VEWCDVIWIDAGHDLLNLWLSSGARLIQVRFGGQRPGAEQTCWGDRIRSIMSFNQKFLSQN
jgi:hypothetical protein